MADTMVQDYTINSVINALEKHRDAHVEEYLKAYENYKYELKKRLSNALDKLSVGSMPNIEYNMGLPKPVLRSDEYEKRINIYRMVVGDKVKLTFTEADQIFNDNWFFLDRQSKYINATYASAGASPLSSDSSDI